MILSADYHTHTVYSHGKGTISDNAVAAKNAGLIELGIADHGFSHGAFGIKKKNLPLMRKECAQATEKTGVKVLLGVEANVLGTDGTVDLKADLYDSFDFFLAGVHKFIFYKFGTMFSMAIPNQFFSLFKAEKVPDRLVKENTRALVNVVKNNPVDAITHVGFCAYADPVEVAKAAADYGTYIEINAKKTHLSDEQWRKVINTEARFLIGSDAHYPARVGEISLAREMLKRIDFPLDRIDNIDGRTPKFRFAAYKGGR
ncbi:MAG: PHP domain-containing protein [Clostridia bacterium]|nr:PHP domain-containing protein [Clostridia bacterium]